MVRVLVNGAKGKMGRMTVEAVKADPALSLVGETDIGDDLIQSIMESGAEVVVDFTIASAAYENFVKILDAGAHPVAGTSGFDKAQVEKLADICRAKKIGGLIAPNFSIGAVLMMKFAQEAAKYIPNAEIVEAHHEQKLDAPSGTAVRTAEMMAEAAALNKAVPKTAKETLAGARGGCLGGIPIHSIRLPGFLAHQRVIFGSAGETLTLEHSSIDRKCFMPGVRLAAQKIVGEKELFYGLETLLFQG